MGWVGCQTNVRVTRRERLADRATLFGLFFDTVLSCAGDKDGVVGRHNPVCVRMVSPFFLGFLFYHLQAIGAGTVEDQTSKASKYWHGSAVEGSTLTVEWGAS